MVDVLSELLVSKRKRKVAFSMIEYIPLLIGRFGKKFNNKHGLLKSTGINDIFMALKMFSGQR